MALPIGPLQVTVHTQTHYFIAIPDPAGATIVWNVTGGNIISGQGTSHIDVYWTEVGEGRVEVTVTHVGSEPVTEGITVIIDEDQVTN